MNIKKEIERLEFKDDFMFNEVMEHEDLCKAQFTLEIRRSIYNTVKYEG